MPQCRNCNYDNRPGTVYCEECGADIETGSMAHQPTDKLDDDRQRASLHSEFHDIIIEVRGSDQAIVLEREGDVVLGRFDSYTPDVVPDVDLTQFGAEDMGVSRIHALIAAGSNPPMLVDLGSANGTFVNGQKLVPDQPWTLHDGDELRFGQLVMRTIF